MLFDLFYIFDGYIVFICVFVVFNRYLFFCEVNGLIKYWDLKKWICLYDFKFLGNVSKMYIVGNFLLIFFDRKLLVINLGNFKEECVVKEFVEMFVVIGKILCIVLECIVYILDILNMKIIVFKDFKIGGIFYYVKCLYFDEVIGYLFIICIYIFVKGIERFVVFRW